MNKRYIDINCDVGEGEGNESDLFPLISSCNIACGGHAGSLETIRTCLHLAKKYGVKIGAHPSYPDRENFGRVTMEISNEKLIESIQNQMQLFRSECEKATADLHHIKPHGALYNDIAKDEKKAKVFLTAINPYKERTYLYVPYGSAVQDLALKQNFRVKREAFADRNYNSDLSLVSRKNENAVITKAEDVWEHLMRMYTHHEVRTVDGKIIKMNADTYCIHGDTPTAFQILMYLTKQFVKQNLQIKI